MDAARLRILIVVDHTGNAWMLQVLLIERPRPVTWAVIERFLVRLTTSVCAHPANMRTTRSVRDSSLPRLGLTPGWETSSERHGRGWKANDLVAHIRRLVFIIESIPGGLSTDPQS
jgi:hypothetical protein